MHDPNLCRFYSPDWLGDLLAARLGSLAPTSVLDLGCGPGALANSAMRRWPNATMVTVDVDGDVFCSSMASDTKGTSAYRHVVADALQFDLIQHFPEPKGIDVVVSNPPYRHVVRESHHDEILKSANLPVPGRETKRLPADVLFLAQALRLTREGGYIAFIVPDSTITGSECFKMRFALQKRHGIVEVVQLPRGTFVGTEAQAFAIIVQKDVPRNNIQLSVVDTDGLTAGPLLAVPSGGTRLDYSFHAFSLTSSGVTLAALGVKISRGRATSKEVSNSNQKIFHTCDFPVLVGAGVELKADIGHRDFATDWAEVGDILVARVDRRLECKIAVVSQGNGPISDCVLRLRAPAEHVDRVLRGLCSDNGQGQLIAMSRGTGARHVSASSLLQIKI